MEAFEKYKQSIIADLKDHDYMTGEDYIEDIIPYAILQKIKEIEKAITYEEFVHILNELLITPTHYSHQHITRLLQQIKNPSSILYIRKVLESGFDFLEYTGSDSEVIAKWFSWALASIGTEEATNLIIEYSNCADEEIRKEMTYRLKKINQK